MRIVIPKMKFFLILFLSLILSFTIKCQSFAGLKTGFDNYLFYTPQYGHSVEYFNYLGSSPIIGVFWRERSGSLVQIAGELTYIYRSFSVNAGWGGLEVVWYFR